jgi:methylenetetrahydrofolate reductase (NADPH)
MMNVVDKIATGKGSGRAVISVEFFPPKDEAGGEQILRTAERIREHVRPDFVSITYGAGGSTRERTLKYARLLKERYDFEVMPHLTCVGASAKELVGILGVYREAGFRNIMALRGDPPGDRATFEPHPEGLRHASDLIQLIREVYPECGIGAAGYPEVHPEAVSAEKDRYYLKRKVEAGAHFITTQLFYDNRQFFAWAQACRSEGIEVPLVPGLMPIRSAAQARRFCKHIPEELEAALSEVEGDKVATRELGIDWTTRQIEGLFADGFRAVHLYIMNRSGAAVEVLERLRKKGLL